MQKAETEVKLSDQITVAIAPLDAAESLSADEIIGDSNSQALANKVYAIGSIRKINGKEAFPLKNLAEFKAVAAQLSIPEVMRLGLAVDDINPIPDDLKKELAARLKNSLPDS